MAAGNIYVFAFITALVAVNLIFAEKSSLEQEFLDQVEQGAEADRETRSANEEGGQERTFSLLFPIITSCNSTTQAGATCTSCTQALRCLSNNVGIIRNCRGFLRYCNNGQCSLFPGANCSSG